jgi:DnaK suppressor protein
VTTKAIKTAKPVKKTAGSATPTIVLKAKRKGSVKAPTAAAVTASAKKAASKAASKPVKKAAPVKAAPAPVKPTPVKSAPAKSTSAKPTPAAPAKAAAPKPKVGKTPTAKAAAVPHVVSLVAPPHATRVPLRPAVNPRTMLLKKNPLLANSWKSKPIEQWSDTEVICMPDDEYMNDKQLAFFRLKLLHLKNDILTNAGETTEHLRSDTVVVPDPADRATIEEEHALELRTRDRERKLLRKIEQSMTRIDAGDYGYCDETGEPIGVARLLARPTATLSLEAQQRRELKQKMFGD